MSPSVAAVAFLAFGTALIGIGVYVFRLYRSTFASDPNGTMTRDLISVLTLGSWSPAPILAAFMFYLGAICVLVGNLAFAIWMASLSPPSRGPFAFGGSTVYPAEYSAALSAANAELKFRRRDTSDYRARIGSCTNAACEVFVYPSELDGPEYRGKNYRDCALTYCATITYSMDSRAVTRVDRWP